MSTDKQVTRKPYRKRPKGYFRIGGEWYNSLSPEAQQRQLDKLVKLHKNYRTGYVARSGYIQKTGKTIVPAVVIDDEDTAYLFCSFAEAARYFGLHPHRAYDCVYYNSINFNGHNDHTSHGYRFYRQDDISWIDKYKKKITIS